MWIAQCTADSFLYLSIFTCRWKNFSNTILNDNRIFQWSLCKWMWRTCEIPPKFATCRLLSVLSAGWSLSWILLWSCTCTIAASWWFLSSSDSISLSASLQHTYKDKLWANNLILTKQNLSAGMAPGLPAPLLCWADKTDNKGPRFFWL